MYFITFGRNLLLLSNYVLFCIQLRYLLYFIQKLRFLLSSNYVHIKKLRFIMNYVFYSHQEADGVMIALRWS
jgi:hypothetical protein